MQTYKEIEKEAQMVAAIHGVVSSQWSRVKEKLRLKVLSDIKKHKAPNMFEAFEMMHKNDGTSQGRKKCDFAL